MMLKLILLAAAAMATAACGLTTPAKPASVVTTKGCEPLAVPPSFQCPASIDASMVYRALMSAEYYRQYGTPDPSDPIEWLMSPAEAATTIVCDSEFGCDRRWLETAEVLTRQMADQADLRVKFQALPVPATSAACCTEIVDCKVERAGQGNHLSAVQYEILVRGETLAIPAKIDPQTWDIARGSPFEIEYLGKDCSEMNDEPEMGFPNKPGEAWTGVIQEDFELFCQLEGPCTRFHNALQISAAIGSIPGEGKETVYRMDYGLCDDGNFTAKIPGSGSYENGLVADCGFSKLDRPGSRVTAAKKLVFSDDLCEGNCGRLADRHFNVSQAILPLTTAITLCSRISMQSYPCVKRQCPMASNMPQHELKNMCRLEE